LHNSDSAVDGRYLSKKPMILLFSIESESLNALHIILILSVVRFEVDGFAEIFPGLAQFVLLLQRMTQNVVIASRLWSQSDRVLERGFGLGEFVLLQHRETVIHIVGGIARFGFFGFAAIRFALTPIFELVVHCA
jgi:hypothetical protein